MSKVYVCPSPPGMVTLMASREMWMAILETMSTDRTAITLYRTLTEAYKQADGGDVQRVTLTPEDAAVVLARARG